MKLDLVCQGNHGCKLGMGKCETREANKEAMALKQASINAGSVCMMMSIPCIGILLPPDQIAIRLGLLRHGLKRR